MLKLLVKAILQMIAIILGALTAYTMLFRGLWEFGLLTGIFGMIFLVGSYLFEE